MSLKELKQKLYHSKWYVGSYWEVDWDIRTWYFGVAWNDYHVFISIGPLGLLHYYN